MDDIDLAEVGFVAVIAIVVGFIIYEILQSINSPSSPIGQAASAVTAPVTAAETTLLGTGGAAGVTGSDSNLFWSGITNFFSTGNLTGDTSSD